MYHTLCLLKYIIQYFPRVDDQIQRKESAPFATIIKEEIQESALFFSEPLMPTETRKGKTKRPPQLGCGLLSFGLTKGRIGTARAKVKE